MADSENTAVVQRMLDALEQLAIDEAKACWSNDARWLVLDDNQFAGSYSVDGYFEMLGTFFEKYGRGYEFDVLEARAHGDLVVLFCHSEQQELGSTDGLMIYRVRDGLIVEGWSMAHGSDSQLPW